LEGKREEGRRKRAEGRRQNKKIYSSLEK